MIGYSFRDEAPKRGERHKLAESALGPFKVLKNNRDEQTVVIDRDGFEETVNVNRAHIAPAPSDAEEDPVENADNSKALVSLDERRTRIHSRATSQTRAGSRYADRPLDVLGQVVQLPSTDVGAYQELEEAYGAHLLQTPQTGSASQHRESAKSLTTQSDGQSKKGGRNRSRQQGVRQYSEAQAEPVTSTR